MARIPNQNNPKTTISIDKSLKRYIRRIAERKGAESTETDSEVVEKLIKHWIDSGKPIQDTPVNTYLKQKVSLNN